MNLTSLQIKRELLNSLWKVVPRTTSLTLGGVRIKVPLGRELDRRVLTLKHEPWMAGLLERILRVKEGGFVDVGANAGQTLLRYKSLFPKGPYVGFEPNCYAAAYVQEIIDLNGWQDCMILPVGLGDQPKVAPLLLANPSDLCATLVPEPHHSADIARPALILEAEQALVLSGMPQPALIKIDAEGFEAEILRGLAGILKSAQPVVICEVLWTGDQQTLRSRNASIQNSLRECGYCVLRAEDNELSLSKQGLIENHDVFVFAEPDTAARLLDSEPVADNL